MATDQFTFTDVGGATAGSYSDAQPLTGMTGGDPVFAKAGETSNDNGVTFTDAYKTFVAGQTQVKATAVYSGTQTEVVDYRRLYKFQDYLTTDLSASVTLTGDFVISFDFSTLTVTSGGLMTVLYGTGNDFIRLDNLDGSPTIKFVIAGAESSFILTASNNGAFNSFKFVRVGSTITAYENDVSLGTASSSASLSYDRIGVLSTNSQKLSGTLKDFYIENAGVPAVFFAFDNSTSAIINRAASLPTATTVGFQAGWSEEFEQTPDGTWHSTTSVITHTGDSVKGVDVNGVVDTFNVTSAPTTPTLTGPSSVTEGTSTATVGTGQDTVTTLSIQTTDEAFSVEQTKGVATGTGIPFTPASGINACGIDAPAAGVPLVPTVSAAGITAYATEIKEV